MMTSIKIPKQTSFIVDIVNIFLLFTDTDFREWARENRWQTREDVDTYWI